MATLYHVLGLAPGADGDAIKQAYRNLAKQYHPDVDPSPEAEARFKQIQSAYELLSDPQQRVQYDVNLRRLQQLIILGQMANLSGTFTAYAAAARGMQAHRQAPAKRDRAAAIARNRKAMRRFWLLMFGAIFLFSSSVWFISRAIVKPAPRLDLSYRLIDSWPESITGSREIRQLIFAHNGFTEVPPEVGTLGALELLNMNDNHITSLPPQVFSLGGLYGLHMAHNAITELPPAVGKLTKLRVLDLSDNQLTDIPDELAACVLLKRVDLRGNAIPAARVRWLKAQLPRADISADAR